jgi:hypothetical protein
MNKMAATNLINLISSFPQISSFLVAQESWLMSPKQTPHSVFDYFLTFRRSATNLIFH